MEAFLNSTLWQHLGISIGLLLVLEGLVPFLYPERWRKLVQQLAIVDNRAMRIAGFSSMALGVALLYLFND